MKSSESLQKIKEPRPDLDEDAILAYLTGTTNELTEQQEKKRKIYDYILVQLLEHRQDIQIVNLLQRQFNANRTTAYQYIKMAKYVHGSFFTIDKGIELYKQQQAIEKALKWAEDTNDLQAYSKAIEMRDKLIQRLPDKEDIDWTKMGAKNYFMILNMPGQEGAIKLPMSKLELMTEKEKQEIITAVTEPAIDIGYELIENNVGNTGSKAV
jgi:hypothetical protein